MTVANIILRGLSLANLTGSAIFSTTEKEDAFNAAYRDIYEKIVDADDDYFITDWAFTLASMTAVSNEPNAYYIALPSSPSPFYRMRVLEYQNGTRWVPVRKYALQDENKRAGGPQYRFKGSYLYIIMPDIATANSFRAWFYPSPTAYSLTPGTTDVTTPPQLEPDLIAYQIAIDLLRKQGADYSKLQTRQAELWGRFTHAINKRDDWGTQKVANVYRSTYGGV